MFASSTYYISIAGGKMNNDKNRYILAWFLGFGLFLLIVLLVFFDIREGSKEIVYTLLGSFSTAFTMTINYFFGSSEGSKEKTKMISKGD